MSRVRKFFALDKKRRRLFLAAYLALGRARLALRTRPFRELTRDLTVHRTAFEPGEPDDASLHEAREVAWAVAAASRFTPWRSTCLVQVLAAQRLLQQRSIPGAIYIGAAAGEGGATAAGLEAHAWLRCGQHFITGQSGHDRYTVVTAFSWG